MSVPAQSEAAPSLSVHTGATALLASPAEVAIVMSAQLLLDSIAAEHAAALPIIIHTVVNMPTKSGEQLCPLMLACAASVPSDAPQRSCVPELVDLLLKVRLRGNC